MALRSDSASQRVVHLLTNDVRNWRCCHRSVKELQSASMRCVHLEAASFDPAVNVNGWARRRQIEVAPPRGVRIVLMSYRMTRKYLDSNSIPFRCFCSVRYLESTQMVRCKLTFQHHSNGQCLAPRFAAKLTVPLMPQKRADTLNVEASDGDVELSDNVAVWSIANVQQWEPMVLRFDIVNVESRRLLDEWLLPKEVAQRPLIQVRFRFVSEHSFSGFNVEGYSAYDLQGEEVPSLQIWKRKQALSGLCLVEMA